MCANDACREPCASDRDCAAGSLCYAATGCILLEGYPLPDGEVVRRDVDGVFEAMGVGGEWLYLLGSTSESPLDYPRGAAHSWQACTGSTHFDDSEQVRNAAHGRVLQLSPSCATGRHRRSSSPLLRAQAYPEGQSAPEHSPPASARFTTHAPSWHVRPLEQPKVTLQRSPAA